ncbi:MAG: DUF167 domain-containing protein [Candidatus Latescibacteria bacterium]|nr:DUF167 domain-containing protein [Candidatus Latescibacterota bacterium]
MDARCRIVVRVQPCAGRNEVVGYDDADRLKVRVNAPPTEGRANKAVCDLLARFFGVPKASVGVVTGMRSRSKIVELIGVNGQDARKRILAGV